MAVVVPFFRFNAAVILYGKLDIEREDLDEMFKTRMAREYMEWVLDRNHAFLTEVIQTEHFVAFGDRLKQVDPKRAAMQMLDMVQGRIAASREPVCFCGEDERGPLVHVYDLTDEEKGPEWQYLDEVSEKERLVIGARCPTSDLLMLCDEGKFKESIRRAVILHEAYCERCRGIWNSAIPDDANERMIGSALSGEDDHLQGEILVRYVQLRKAYDIAESIPEEERTRILEAESHLCYCMACQRKVVQVTSG